VESLEAALWAFHRSDSFEEGALLAANLGDDADTTAAIYGQLAGACYGEEGIPRRWRACLTDLELIEALAEQLLELADGKDRHGPG
jgi:ADP-ribosylglycohydrolase